MTKNSKDISGDRFDELDRDLEAADEKSRIKDREKAPRPGQEPPRTRTGPIVAPKFGSAGSGGAELDPGPERA